MARPKTSTEGTQERKKEQAKLPAPPPPPPPHTTAVSAAPTIAPPTTGTESVAPPVAPPAATPKVQETHMPSTGFRAPNLKVYSYTKTDDRLKNLRKKMNDAIMNPSRGPVVSTGVAGVDLCLEGGVNFGSVHEFFGFSKAGKTYLMQRVAAVAQSMFADCIVVYFDRENACSADIMAGMGIDVNRALLIPPSEIATPEVLWVKIVEILVKLDSLDADKARVLTANLTDLADDDEETVEALKKDTKDKKGDKSFTGRDAKATQPHVVFVIDSIPAFAEQLDMIEDQGRRAKKWHAFFRRATTLLNSKTMFMVSNHIIYKPGLYQPGGNESKTSGVAIDYYRDGGVKCMQLHKIFDAGDMEVGAMLAISVDKNRRGGAGAHTCFPVYYSGGASYWSGILPFAEYIGLAKLSNEATFKADKKKYGRVWARYRVSVGEGKEVVMSEENPAELEELCVKHGLYDKIKSIVEGKLGMTKGSV